MALPRALGLLAGPRIVACLLVAALVGVGGRSALADEPAAVATTNPETPNPETLEFVERQVRPLLIERCHKCHGDLKEPKGGLKLTDRATVLKGGESGPAAVAGKPADSYLIQTIGYRDALQMPPDSKLSDAQIATLTRWVELGLPWPESSSQPAPADDAPHPYQITDEQRQFWAFQKVKVVPPPAVEETAWPRGEIDRYILARLQQDHLPHAPQADRRTLIRRATFDLTGLPPTPGEVAAFLADQSPDAFATLVDRLLATPQYGERWGRHWLDVARYTDCGDARDLRTKTPSGLTETWRYRDWVVRAMNRDLPYDRFIVDQLAGDLVEPATPERLNVEGQIATGFLAVGAWGNGDADKEKMLTDIVDDQLNATSRAFLALTVTCARCHDHKFDPIPTADYYSLAGIFYSTHILPNVGPKTDGAPMLRVPLLTANQLAAREADGKQLADLKGRLAGLVSEDYQSQAKNLLPQIARYLVAAWEYQNPAAGAAPQPIEAFATAHQLDPRLVAQWLNYLGQVEPQSLSHSRPNADGNAGVHAWVNGNLSEPSFKVNTNDAPAAYLTWVIPPHSAAVHPSPSTNVLVAWRSPIAGTVRIRGRVSDGDPNGGNGYGYSVARRHGHAIERLVAGVLDNGGKQDFAALPSVARLDQVDVQPGDLIWLSISPRDGDYGYDTTIVELEIAETIADGRAWSLARDVIADPLADGQGNPHRDALGNADVWQFFELASAVDNAASVEPDSPLARWFAAIDAAGPPADKVAQVRRLADELQQEALAAAAAAGDAKTNRWYSELTSSSGPLRPADKLDEKFASEATRTRLAEMRSQIATLEPQLAEPIPVCLGAQEGGVPQTVYEGIHDCADSSSRQLSALGRQRAAAFPPHSGGRRPDADHRRQRPAGIGPLAGQPRQSADRPGDGQPHLAASFWRGDRPLDEQFRQAGRAADSSRTARLSGRSLRPTGLVDEGPAPRNHALGHVSTSIPGRSANRRARS